MDELNLTNFDKIIKEKFLMSIIHGQIEELLIDSLLHLHHVQDVVLIVYDMIKNRNIYHDQMPVVLKMVAIHLLQSYDLNNNIHNKLDAVLDKSIELLFYKPNKHNHCKCCIYF
jgi:hypothetical protein